MEVKIVHSASEVYDFLKDRVRYDYIYQFNDLSTKEWGSIICYGLYDNGMLMQIAMLLINYDIPVLLAAGFDDGKYSCELMSRIKKYMPVKFYTHMDMVTLKNAFSCSEILDLHEYVNMGLCDYSMLNIENTAGTVRLGYKDIGEIKELMAISYPEAWLDDELVKLDENFGIYEGGKLVSFAGIHAYSEEYQVAAVAHVTTHPDCRGKGYAKKVVGALSIDLKDKIKHIGLNVRIDNPPAIEVYKKLGFREFGRFAACEVVNNISFLKEEF